MKGKHYIGTSGWHYDHWRGLFYPKELPSDKMLEFYSRVFSTVEINNTFYKLVDKKVYQLWKDSTPDEFIFSVKASRLITHYQKLKNVSSSLKKFLSNTKYLGNKLGPYLFLLPSNFGLNYARLESFLKQLPKGSSTIEFRDISWLEEDIYLLLKDYKCAFCIYEFGDIISPHVITTDFVYVRLHGPSGPYSGRYSKKSLSEWASKILRWNQMNKDVFVYFDNDEKGYAPINASELIEML